MVKVSVIISVGKNENFLKESLVCIVNQTEKDIEIICIDDDCSDKSLSILESYAERDSRFKLFKEKNSFAAQARNKGIEISQGKYLYFFDSVDLCSSELLEKALVQAEETDADISVFNGEKFWEDGRKELINGFNRSSVPSGKYLVSREDLPDLIIQRTNAGLWNKLFRADFVKSNNLKFTEDSPAEDLTFAALSNAMAERMTFIDERLYKCRVINSDSADSIKSNKLKKIKAAVEKAEREIKALPYFETLKGSLKSFVIENLAFDFNSQNISEDFNSETVREYYSYVHEKFNQKEFSEPGEYIKSSPSLYYNYSCIKKSSYEEMQKMKNRRLIVSVTSYPARIKSLAATLQTILLQNEEPYKVLIYLSKEQFPNLEKDLSDDLLKLLDGQKVEVRWVNDDLRPHKKYFYAFQEFPEDLIVTIDDDLIYSPETLTLLHKSYFIHPDCVSGLRGHIIAVDNENKILPYKSWIKSTNQLVHIPNHQLLITGGAGTLYPANLFQTQTAKEMLDTKLIKELCLTADDLWLKAIEVLNNIPVVLADERHSKLYYVPGSQEIALWKTNVDENQNDIQLENIIKWTVQKYSEDLFTKRIAESANQLSENPLSRDFLYTLINNLCSEKNQRTAFAERFNEYEKKARIDIKNFGKASNAIEIIECSDKTSSFTNFPFLNDSKGSGQLIESKDSKLSFSFKTIGEGELRIQLRALCIRDGLNKAIPFGICYTKFSVNNKDLFSYSHIQTHDSPYIFKQQVKDGDIFNCSLEWKATDNVNKELKNFYDEKQQLNNEIKRLKNYYDENSKLKENIKKLSEEKQQLNNEIKRLKNSLSFKIGRLITFIPRKIRGAFRILKKSGIKGVLKRLIKKS